MSAKRAWASSVAILALGVCAGVACTSAGSGGSQGTPGGGSAGTSVTNPGGGASAGASVVAGAGTAGVAPSGGGACTGSNCTTSGAGTGQGGATNMSGGGAGGAAPCTTCDAGKVFLHAGWNIQASSKVAGSSGAQISAPGFATTGWYPVTVPTTVFAGLVANQVYPDPFIGDNLTKAPASIASSSWWYRTEFTPTADFAGQAAFLASDGINYKANVWLNGQQIAKSDSTVGTFTSYVWNVSAALKPGLPNALAVEILPPDLANDLALSWLDWNPGPPDRDMGIWQNVYLRKSAAVAVRGTHVTSKVDPSLASAELTIKADLVNTTAAAVHTTVTAKIDQIMVSQDVDLAASETKTVTFQPSTSAALKLAAPRLWWPAQMGAQELYQVVVSAQIAAAASDSETVQFGIRDVTSSLDSGGHRLFTINGKRILIRGGGWASDMLLRMSAERLDAQF